MNSHLSDHSEPEQGETILVLTPLGKDAEVTNAVLREAGLRPAVCATLLDLVEQITDSIGALLIAEEALAPVTIHFLLDCLDRQPAWSDIPILLLTSSGNVAHESRRAFDLLGPHSNVTVLERPIRVLTLTSALRAALRARRRQFQVRNLLQQREQVLASIQDAFVLMDSQWRYTYVNAQACELCQMAAEQLLGKSMWELFPATIGTPFEERVRTAMSEQTAVHFEWFNDRWNRWFHIRAYPADSGIALFTVEITDRKQVELELERARTEAIEANRAKDQFLAALSHELRTPLNPVLMTVAALRREEGVSELIRRDLEMIHRQVELEARLIDDLLDLTRVTRGKLMLRREIVDLHELVQHAIETCCGKDVMTKRVIVEHHASAPEHHVTGDPARLQQVLWNLLNNAIKFTPEGGKITVSTRNTAAGRIEIRVADSGIGIDADLLPRLFNAFEQGNANITRRFGGLGLGLAISKAIADLHEGTLRAESRGRGHGSEFILGLNTTPQDSESAKENGTVQLGPQRSLRVLLVEDHEPTRGVLERLFTRAGHNVKGAGTVADALHLATEHPFDLLVSDLGLPDASGLHLMRELKARHGLRGIALSGFGMEEDLRASADAGFVVHLTKPVDWGQIEAALSGFGN